MRLAWVVALLLGVPAGVVAAEDRTPRDPIAEVAQAVIAAHGAQDAQALEELAAADDPDPWLVADLLLERGAVEAAAGFAAASPRPSVERLPAYVAAQRGLDVEAPVRATLLAAAAARAAQDMTVALAKLEALEPRASTVLDVRVRALRARVQRAHGLTEGAGLEAQTAAQGADALGWTALAVSLWMESGKDAFDQRDFASARRRWQRALEHYEAQGDDLSVAHTLGNMGLADRQGGQVADSLAAYQRAAGIFRDLGESRHAAWMLDAVGLAHVARGDYPAARGAFEEALLRFGELAEVGGQGRALAALGRVRAWLGEPAEGLAAQVEARRLLEQAGDVEGLLHALLNTGEILQARGDVPGARAQFEEARRLATTQGNHDYVARANGYLGALAAQLGDYGRALQEFGKAERILEQRGDRVSLGMVLRQIADVRRMRGDYVEALRLLDAAEGLLRQAGGRPGLMSVQLALGQVYADLGDPRRALPLVQVVVTEYEKSGFRSRHAAALRTQANLHGAVGATSQSRASEERALAIYEALGDIRGTAYALCGLADALRLEGHFVEARATLERAQALQRQLKDRRALVISLLTHGQILLAQDKPQEALEPLEQARRDAAALGTFDLVVGAHALLAEARLAAGSPELALETARGATQYLDTLARGQGEEQGASARARHSRLYDTGAGAAAALGDATETFFWLETGRAGTLLESLGGRDALLAATVPEALRAAKALADEHEAGARRAYYDSLEQADPEARRGARAALDAAVDEGRAAAERIVRESKTEARMLYPRALPLEELQALLEPGEALVEYGLLPLEAVAVVVTADEARVVRLGACEDVVAACEELVASSQSRDAQEPARALADLVVKPLALGPDVQRVLISPDGALSYVPFALLLPTHQVGYVPSGTTLAELLKLAGERGTGVLALGDPDYSTHDDAKSAEVLGAGRTLKPLPHTRAEVQAVGTRRLLGREATLTRLRAVVTERPRWRAIHLACHGLVDPRRPLLSSLALSAEPGDDGYLTALEVCQQPLPADLAVLSACETGKGRIFKGEGIVGLTRAFMFAGAPRVLCSLWKVDDAATKALMTTFYALWLGKDGAPGLPATAALRQAQAEVRAQEGWAHPHFWAAWVLWGVPR